MEYSVKKGLVFCVLAGAMSLVTPSGDGAAAATVAPGDAVGVHFTCRLKSGEVAATSEKSVSEDGAALKSNIFFDRGTYDPVVMRAGDGAGTVADKQYPPFELAVISLVSEKIVGMEVGSKHSMEISGGPVPFSEGESGVLKMPRLRDRAKEIRMSRANYEGLVEKAPRVGDDFSEDPAVPGKVVSFTDDEIVIRNHAEPGSQVDTPFGKADVKDAGDRYELRINPVAGTLVRSGGWVGVITQVDDDYFILDYGRPLAGETLACDVSVSEPPVDALQAKEPSPQTGNGGDTSEDEAQKAEAMKTLEQAFKLATQEGKADIVLPGSLETLPDVVQQGDLVSVNYTMKVDKGEIVRTTLAAVAADSKQLKSPNFEASAEYGPDEILAGKDPASFGLAAATLGMKVGEKKSVTVPPEQAFGLPDIKKIAELPCEKTAPRNISMSPEDYLKRFGTLPIVGKEVSLDPYNKARIKKVEEKSTVLEITSKKKRTIKEPFGTVEVVPSKDSVKVTLIPKLGATFIVQGRVGNIVKTDGKTFTVDLNSPLAGKTLSVDLEVVGLTKASTFAGKDIEWIEDHDQGIQRVKQEGKPGVLVLYADWCKWCKKLVEETFVDPRVKLIEDQFVWIKVNSDKNKEYMEKYGQKGFPFMVILNEKGEPIKTLDGFKDARAFRAEVKDLPKAKL